MKTKKTLPSALVALFTVVGCAAGSEPDADEEAVEQTDRNASALVNNPIPSPTPFCLPGEVRKCTLGPPPVCSCVPLVPPVLKAVAR